MNHGDRTLVECGAPIALGVLLFTWACSREPTTRPASSVLTRIAPAKAPSAAHAPPSVVATKLDRASATHLLNRFAFGPSPHDLQQVMELGAQAWFAVQLEPDKLSDVGGDQALAPYKDVLAPPAEIPKRFAKYDMLAEDDGEEVALGARINRDTDFSRVIQYAQMCQIVRQVASQRQVQEVMADFWLNHFNVFARKGLVKLYAADYVERAIRPNALGRFEDLLVATARHPAMLLYLDNAKSSAPPPPGSPAARQHRRGITENYARELLELHTLGVDGGYTQNDVIEVARVLTGWSVSGPEEGDLGYKFRERLHDRGEKIVLGQTYPAGGGEDEGLRLLHQLAEHPSTARHLARKLCERFVADRPPASCVESAARAYLGSNGDIRVTLRAIEESPEFWENRGNKLKSPLRFVVSALRSVGAKLEPTTHLSNALNRLGQGLLLEPVPTGYPETAEEWASAGSALARMHFATLLGTGRLPGVSVDTQQLFKSAETADQIVVSINDAVLGQSGSPRTVKLLTDQLRGVESPEQRRAVALALALGSPDFQRQ